VQATGRVEISKTKTPAGINHPKETLTIAKNVSAIQIAKSTAQTEVVRAVSRIEIARSSMEASLTDGMPALKKESLKNLEEIKAKATANISSYLAKIEIVKSHMLSKIASEVAAVEIAKINANEIDKVVETQSTTYPKMLIKKN